MTNWRIFCIIVVSIGILARTIGYLTKEREKAKYDLIGAIIKVLILLHLFEILK